MLPELVTSIPGPRSRELSGELRRFEAREVTFLADDFPVFWERAADTNVWDADGNRFLDFTSAFGVSGLGHTPKAVQDALFDQAGRLFHAMGDVHPPAVKAHLCRVLNEITFERWGAGAGKTLLGNAGFEAVEIALKTALLHSGKPGIISFTGGYHGLGYGALEAGGLPYFRDPFRSHLARFGVQVPFPGCYRCPQGRREGFRLEGDPFPNCSTPCLESIRQTIEDTIRHREIGAIIVEPMQGRGGEIIPPRDFLPLLRAVCDEHKILLVLDEIYTGFNRTGRLFACEHSEVVPDLICLGKGLTNGFPLSACVGRADIMDAWPLSQGEAIHTSTMLGNPLGCAMALASIEVHRRDETARQSRRTGLVLKQRLASLASPWIGDLRGIGSMIGLELVHADGTPHGELAGQIMRHALRDGLILLSGGPAGNILSFTPSFFTDDAEIAFLGERLQEYLISLPGSIS